MRKLLRELFYVPKYGKVREKTMITYVTMTALIIVFCLAAMGFTAYAYFSHNVSSSHNIIKSATFETNVKIQIKTNTGEEVQVITSNYKSHTASLTANTKYFVTLTPTEKSTAETGFVIVTAEGCENRYHTEQLGIVGDSQTNAISFYLISGANTKVTFLAHWGTSSFYSQEDTNKELYIKQGETVNIPINGIPGTNEQDTHPTTPVVTAPTVTDPTVTAPTVTTPTVTTPTVTTPTVTAPTVTTPTVTDPTVTAPTVTTPTVTDPTVTTPTVTDPTVTDPTVTDPTVTDPTTTTETVHTVVEGETLTAIAKLHNTTVDQLAIHNEITDIDTIQIGQVLRIPQAEEITPEATTTPPTVEDSVSSKPTEPTTAELNAPQKTT